MRLFAAIALFLLATIAAAREEVDGKKALAIDKTLADDSFGGRKSGLESGRKAEAWMAAHCKAIGLSPGNGESFFLSFSASVTTETAPPLLVAAGKPASYRKDYVTLLYSGEGDVEGEVAFVGYGIHAPDKGRDDYAGIDVKGRIVMAVRGKPRSSVFDEERYIGYKSSTAFDRGAIGFLLVEGDKAISGTIQERYHRAKLPAVWLARGVADLLLSRAKRPNLAAQIEALQEGTGNSFPLQGVRVHLVVHGKLLKDTTLRNVVGLWPGDGRSDETVVLGAHLDHLGTDPTGKVFNGADDNASGSAMLAEVARAVVRSGVHFKRNLMFVWFAGEEQGLLGSRAFVEQPPLPLEEIAVMINTDMVGQGKPELAIGGAENFPRDAAALGVPKGARPFRAGPNSDHFPFQDAGVPAFFVHTQGPHPNYHQPEDDWPAIRPELLQLAGRYVRALAERAANSDAAFCRPNRYAEYLWNASPVADLDAKVQASATAGIDLRVAWFRGDFNALDRELTRLERKGAPEKMLLPGAASTPGLKPRVAFGLQSPGATRLHRPAGRLGVLFFAPYVGADFLTDPTDLFEMAKHRPAIVSLEKAPQDLDLKRIRAPLLLPIERFEQFRVQLEKRQQPWLAIHHLQAAPASTWRKLAAEILAEVKVCGVGHLLVVPGDLTDPAYKAQAPTFHPGIVAALLMAGAKPRTIRRLLGGNLVRLLEKTRKPPS